MTNVWQNMTGTVAIICNGEFPRKPYPLYLIRTADVIICCDGAAAAYFRNMKRIFGPENPERQPDVIIGDMDSLPRSIAGKFGGRLIHIAEQETNDLSKAVNYAVSEIPGISKILIFGASGKREDHTIGNMALLMEFAGKFPGHAFLDNGKQFRLGYEGLLPYALRHHFRMALLGQAVFRPVVLLLVLR